MTIEVQDRPSVHTPAHEELKHNLSRLAMTHPKPAYALTANERYHGSQIRDRATRTVLEGGHWIETKDRPVAAEPEHVSHMDSRERTYALHVIHDAIAAEAEPNINDGGEAIHWQAVSSNLLEKARELGDSIEAEHYYVAAVTAAQFSPDNTDREHFLREVYDRGLARQMAVACENSKLVLVTEYPYDARGDQPSNPYTQIHPVRHYADVFKIGPKRLNRYLAHAQEGSEHDTSGHPTAKSLQKSIAADPELLQHEHVRDQAADVSLSGEKVQGLMLDPDKIERFGLQEYFIRKQMDALFNSEDVRDSHLAWVLTQNRGQSTIVSNTDIVQSLTDGDESKTKLLRDVAQLSDDVSTVIQNLSNPVITKFSLDGVDISNPAAMTDEQRATWRYRTVVKNMQQHDALSQYLDFEAFTKRADTIGVIRPDDEIWTQSEEGAAAPGAATNAIDGVITAALNSGLTDISEEELRDFAHSKRRRLLTGATRHIEDFGGDIDDMFTAEKSELYRDELGKLQIKPDLKLMPQDSLDIYSAIALGCPVLRIQHANRSELSQLEKLTYGSSNYIDHMLAVIINEAYARGMFHLPRYKQDGEQKQ